MFYMCSCVLKMNTIFKVARNKIKILFLAIEANYFNERACIGFQGGEWNSGSYYQSGKKVGAIFFS